MTVALDIPGHFFLYTTVGKTAATTKIRVDFYTSIHTKNYPFLNKCIAISQYSETYSSNYNPISYKRICF